MVPTLISEAITLCAVVKIKSLVNGSDLKFGSGDRNMFFKWFPHSYQKQLLFPHFPNSCVSLTVPTLKSEVLTEIYVSQMVLTLILEAITICAVVKMKSPVNGSNLKFRSIDGNICFFKWF